MARPQTLGQEDDINIPIIQGEEREQLWEKRTRLKALTDLLKKEINANPDKSTITSDFLQKIVKKFHKPSKAKKEFEKFFFDVIDICLSTHKLSEPRLKNFRVLARCLHRFELYKKKETGRGSLLTFNGLFVEVLRQIENFLSDEQRVFRKYPEIYEQFPYSAKIAVKTPTRKRPPILDAEGNEVPKGMTSSRTNTRVENLDGFEKQTSVKGVDIYRQMGIRSYAGLKNAIHSFTSDD